MSRLTRLALRFPAPTLALVAAATALFAAGLPRLRTDVGYRAFLGERHPSVRRLDAFVERFGGGLPLLAVWRCGDDADDSPCDSALDPSALRMARDVAAHAAESAAVGRVESPATSTLLVPSALGPLPRSFVEDGRLAPDREALARRALRDPTWTGRLVSADGRTGAIVLQLAGSGSDTARDAYAALDRALAPWEEEGFRFARVGGPVEFVVAGRELERATAALVPVMVAIVGATLLVLFRSPAAALLTLVSVGVAVVWTLGLLGWLSAFGWAQNSLTQTLPPLVLVIGVCDAIHLVSRYASDPGGDPGGGPRGDPERGPGADRSRSERTGRLLRVAEDLGRPCAMTTFTTAVGFLSFATAPLQSFGRFGLLAAWGVTAALLLTFTLLPLLLRAVSPARVRDPHLAARWQRAIEATLRLARERPGSVVATSAVLGGTCALGLTHLRVDASFEELYGESSRVVRWARFASEHLRRPDTLEIELALPEGRRLADPAALETIADLERRLGAIDTLGPAHSLLDPLGWTRRLLAGDDPAAQGPAPSAERNEALLALVSAFGAGVGEDALAPWTDAGRRHVRISVESEKTPQAELRRVMEKVRALLDELPPGWEGRATGPLAVVHDMIDAIRATQLRSFAAAGIGVLLLVALFLRSLAWAALALVPTVLPVVLTLGAMGWLGVPLDVGSAMVAAVVVGLAVDDAIHVLEQFRRRRAALPPVEAIHDAVLHVGRAVVTTSLALTLGFAALLLSPWQSVAHFGLVSAVAILTALVATLLVLPALVLLFERARARQGT